MALLLVKSNYFWSLHIHLLNDLNNLQIDSPVKHVIFERSLLDRCSYTLEIRISEILIKTDTVNKLYE